MLLHPSAFEDISTQPVQNGRLISRDDACNDDATTYQPQCSLDEPLVLVSQSTISNCQAKTKGMVMDSVNACLCSKCSAQREQRARQNDLYKFLTNMGGDYDDELRDLKAATVS